MTPLRLGKKPHDLEPREKAGFLGLDRRNRDPAAMPAFTAQPAEKNPHQHPDVEPIGLGSPVLA